MAKFKFRLQTLLRLRETVRDERRGLLAQAYQAEEILQEQQTLLDGQLRTLLDESRQAAGPGPVDVDRLVLVRRFELALRFQKEQLGRQQTAIAVEIERRREALVEANREVRVMELLRDKQLARHREQEDARALALLDEVGQRRGGGEDEP